MFGTADTCRPFFMVHLNLFRPWSANDANWRISRINQEGIRGIRAFAKFALRIVTYFKPLADLEHEGARSQRLKGKKTWRLRALVSLCVGDSDIL